MSAIATDIATANALARRLEDLEARSLGDAVAERNAAQPKSMRAVTRHSRKGLAFKSNEWTPERVAILRREWGTQASARTIADILNRQTGASLSRCAVIGKARRLHLAEKPRPKSTGITKPRRRRARVELVSTKRDRPAPIPGDANIGFGTPVGLLDLNSNTCRWPIGDTHDPGFTFCGAPPAAGCPYCARHQALAYDPNVYAVRSQIGTLNLRNAA